MDNILNEKQKQFCREYIKDFNGTQAGIRAGYSEKTAYAQCSRLLRKVKVQEYIAELKHEAAVKSRVTPEWILTKLEEIVEMGLAKKQTDVVVKESVAPGVTQSYSQKMTKADLAAAKSALDLLGRYHGIFTDKVETSGTIVKRIINVNPTKAKA